MRSFRNAFLSLLGVTLFISIPAVAQQPKPQNCNQPMAEPVVHVSVPGGAAQFPQTRIGQFTVTGDGCWILVAVTRPPAAGGQGIEVLRRDSGRIEHFRFLPGAGVARLTRDERMLVVHAERQMTFIDFPKLIAGEPDVEMGRIRSDRFGGGSNMAHTSNGRYVFVSETSTGWVSVIDLERARSAGFDSPSVVVGGVAVAGSAQGVVLSADERYLYVAAEATPNLDWPAVCKNDPRPGNPTPHRESAIWVVDARQAIMRGAGSVVGIVPAGCLAVRFARSPDGKTLYATDKLENALLAFDIGSPETARSPRRIGRVPVGPNPVGVTLIDGGKKVVVANSNDWFRNPHSGPLQFGLDDATIIDAARVKEGAAAVLGTIPTGGIPLAVASTSDGRTLFVINNMSLTLQVVDLDRVKLDPVKK